MDYLYIKQIADELGISKQKVYRFIKKENINESYQENSVMYYDDVAENRITSYNVCYTKLLR